MMAMAAELPSARGQSPEELYRAGAFRVASDSFAARAVKEPEVPAHWYNLGDALYRAGEDAAARAAWIQAARLAPRSPEIREALRLVTPPDANSAAVTEVTPLTPGEAGVIGAALWIIGWLLVGLRRSGRVSLPLVVAGAAIIVLAAAQARAYRQPIALIRHANTSLRAAPFASAQMRRAMEMSTTVEILDHYAGWMLVKRANDRGWVQQSEVIPISPVDFPAFPSYLDVGAPREGNRPKGR
jgi:hypothetical protein